MMTDSSASRPSTEELRDAFQAGFDSIDDGDGFYHGFHNYLQQLGFGVREDMPCTCSDNGAHGHQPECRWIKA